MSLISDALKTAQRERSGHAKSDPVGEPMLEGFFPYISTSSSEGRSNLQRVIVLSGASVIVVATAVWFGLPMIRRALDRPTKKTASIVLPARPTVTTPSPSPIQVVQAADTAHPVTLARDTAAPAAANPGPPARTSGTSARRPKPAAPRTIVSAADPSSARRDSEIVQPSAPLPSAPETRPSTRPNFEAQAVAAFNAGDYLTARSRFQSAVRVAPTASAWTNYGVTLEKLGDPRAAMKAYRAATGIDASYFNAWLYLARVYNLLGDVTQAVPLFDRARELEPTNSDVNADLAELEYKSGAFTEARRFANVAVQSNPANGRAQYYLALAADTLKDRAVARQAFEDYLRAMVGQEKENAASMGYARVRLQELKGKP